MVVAERELTSLKFEQAALAAPEDGVTIAVDVVDDLSLRELQQSNRTIIRTPHIGNIYVANLAFLDAVSTARLVVYDRNYDIDEIYTPIQIRRSGKTTYVANYSKRQLSPFFQPSHNFEQAKDQLPGDFRSATSPAQLHMETLKVTAPSSVTFSDWVLENGDLVNEVVSVIGSSGIKVFDRRVDERGIVHDVWQEGNSHDGHDIVATAKFFAEAVRSGNHQTPPSSLRINANEVNIYLLMLAEAVKQENQVNFQGQKWGYVLHGAGTTMANYVNGHTPRLQAMHEAVTQNLPYLVAPEKIFFGVVPNAQLRLALPLSQKDTLEQIGSLIKQRFETRSIAKAEQGYTTEEQQAARLSAVTAENALKLLMKEGKTGLDFHASYSPTALSHYDTLDSGSIVVSKTLLDLPLSEIATINTFMGSLYKKK